MTLEVRTITACRSCGSPRLESVLDLGLLAVNDFVSDGQPVDYAPLELARCEECTLVQLRHTVPRERLYRNYFYRSGTNESMVAALRDVVEDAASRVNLQPGDVWIDIGANDGTLLRQVPNHIVKMGFEPASNLFREAVKGGNLIYPGFFPPEYDPPAWKAKVITAIACFYDLDDPNAFVAAVKKWLHPEGVWVVQFQDLRSMLQANAVDNVCHEHLEYYSTQALADLLNRHGLIVADLSYNVVNGGSLRVVARHGQGKQCFPLGSHERPADLVEFAREARSLKIRTVRALEGYRDRGIRVLGYGASTKGNTLLQYYGITPDLLPAIADRNPDKWGKRTVGTNIPIISEEEARAMKPDYLFVLPWHFMDSFRKRERAFLERGGKFIVPLPTLRVEGLDHADLPEKAA